MNEIKSINDMPLHDTVARASIAELRNEINNIEVDIDLSDYATKTYVDEAIENIDIGDINLSNYATKDEIPKNVSQLNNDEGYLTESEINELLENVNTEDLTHVFLTKEEYNALFSYEKNDESKLYIITDIEEDINLNNYATKAYVNEAIENIDIGDIDLSGYALKTDIPSVPTKTSQLTNDSGFLTSIPSTYITESELTAKGYATTTYVDNLIGDVGALLDTLNGEVI